MLKTWTREKASEIATPRKIGRASNAASARGSQSLPDLNNRLSPLFPSKPRTSAMASTPRTPAGSKATSKKRSREEADLEGQEQPALVSFRREGEEGGKVLLKKFDRESRCSLGGMGSMRSQGERWRRPTGRRKSALSSSIASPSDVLVF